MIRKLSLLLHQRTIGLLLVVASSLASGQSVSPPEPSSSALDEELFYELLVGELSVQSGDTNAGFALFLDAARKSNDAKLYERAIQAAMTGRNGEAALQSAYAWTRAHPGAVDANRYLTQILIGLNKMPDLVTPMRRALSLMNLSEKLSTIESLPRQFARANDRRQAAITVDQILMSETHASLAGPLSWAVIGQVRLQAGDTAGAVAAARKGAAMNPMSAAPATLALALLPKSAPEVEPIVMRYLNDSPSPEYRMAYIRYLVGSSRVPAAHEQTQLLTLQAPNFAEGWLVRGSLEFQMGKVDEAETALLQYLAVLPASANNAEPREMDRPTVTALLLLAQIAEQGKRFNEATAYLKRINSSADVLRVGVRRATILARQGDLQQGLELIRNLPEITAEAAVIKVSAEVQLLRGNNETEAAYRVMESAVQKFPDNMDLKYDLAMMAEKASNFDVMEQLMRQVIAAKPDYYAAYNALGYSLADRNLRLPEARELVSKALEMAPKDPFIVDSMAWVEFRSGNTAEAARLLYNAFRDRPDAEIAAHLGEVLWTIGKRDEADAIWTEGMRINAENETLLETTRRLKNTQ